MGARPIFFSNCHAGLQHFQRFCKWLTKVAIYIFCQILEPNIKRCSKKIAPFFYRLEFLLLSGGADEREEDGDDDDGAAVLDDDEGDDGLAGRASEVRLGGIVVLPDSLVSEVRLGGVMVLPGSLVSVVRLGGVVVLPGSLVSEVRLGGVVVLPGSLVSDVRLGGATFLADSRKTGRSANTRLVDWSSKGRVSIPRCWPDATATASRLTTTGLPVLASYAFNLWAETSRVSALRNWSAFGLLNS